MLFSIKELVDIFNISPNGVLHIGAHLAEESKHYEQFNWTPVVWVEANPNLIEILESNLDQSKNKIISACISEKHGDKVRFYVSNNSQSSSLLRFGLHSKYYKNIVLNQEIELITSRIDKIFTEETIPNFINLDIQGVELSAIKSLGSLIEKVQYIYTEVNKKEIYLDCCLIHQIDTYLEFHGFRRMATRYYLRQGWGDAIYIRYTNKEKLKFKNRVLLIYYQLVYYFEQFKVHFRNKCLSIKNFFIF